MSSDSRPAEPQGRCLFCSLGCPLQLEVVAPQVWRTRHAAAEGSLCVRGQMIADLLRSPDRVYRPRNRLREESLTEAIDAIAAEIQTAGSQSPSVTIWLDGNVPVEDVAAARSFIMQRSAQSQLLVHLPPQEFGAVGGLDASGATQASPQEWGSADAILVVGDPFATHPVSAQRLLRHGRDRVDTPMIVVDGTGGVTSRFTPFHFGCRPGTEYWVVAALLAAAGLDCEAARLPDPAAVHRAVNDSGIDPARVDRAANRLRSAERPAVVISPQTGSAERWRALTELAGIWARQHNAMITVLTGSANALAVARYMNRHQIPCWGGGALQSIGHESNALFIIGWDPSSAYPRACWGNLIRHVRHVMVATAFPPADDSWFDRLVPVALPFESSGTFVLADGRRLRCDGVMIPPSGVPTVRGLLGMIGERLDGASADAQRRRASGTPIDDRDIAPQAPAAFVPPAEPGAIASGGWPAVLVADPTQYFDGQITRHAQWSKCLRGRPELWLAPEDARALGLRDGMSARVRGNRHQIDVRVAVTKELVSVGGCFAEPEEHGGRRPAGWLAITGSHADVRQMAPWSFDGDNEWLAAGMMPVEIVSDRGATRREETLHGQR